MNTRIYKKKQIQKPIHLKTFAFWGLLFIAMVIPQAINIKLNLILKDNIKTEQRIEDLKHTLESSTSLNQNLKTSSKIDSFKKQNKNLVNVNQVNVTNFK